MSKTKCMWCDCEVDESTPKFTIYFNIDNPKPVSLSKHSFPLTYAQIACDNDGFCEQHPYNITACSRKCFLFMENHRENTYIDNNEKIQKKIRF